MHFRREVQLVKGFVVNLGRHALHDGDVLVDHVVVQRGSPGVIDLAMLLAGAHQGRHVGRIRAAQGVMESDQAAAALHIGLQAGALFRGHVTGIAAIDGA